MRKTIEVERVREMANHFLDQSKDDQQDARIGVMGLLEGVLMATDNYHGFRFTDCFSGAKDGSRRYYF